MGVAALFLADAFLIHFVRKKRKGSFKLVIEKGIVTENIGNVPPEFLSDIQQLFRLSKPDSLIINGSGIATNKPRLEFLGNISVELKDKIERSLTISLQKKVEDNHA